MAGCALDAHDTHDDVKVTDFAQNIRSLFDRIGLLSQWAADRVRTNLERISITGDMGLPAYLALVRENNGKEEALKGLVRYMR